MWCRGSILRCGTTGNAISARHEAPRIGVSRTVTTTCVRGASIRAPWKQHAVSRSHRSRVRTLGRGTRTRAQLVRRSRDPRYAPQRRQMAQSTGYRQELQHLESTVKCSCRVSITWKSAGRLQLRVGHWRFWFFKQSAEPQRLLKIRRECKGKGSPILVYHSNNGSYRFSHRLSKARSTSFGWPYFKGGYPVSCQWPKKLLEASSRAI